MKPPQSTYTPTKGSALLTVIFLVFIMAMLSASIIGYSLFELRSNERTRLSLRSENVAENIALYAAEQLTAKLQRMGTAEEGHFPWTGPATNTRIVYMPPASTSGTDNVLVSEYNSLADTANMEVRAGIESKTDYVLVTDPTNPNNGLQVATANVPIIAKGTASHPGLGTITTYVEQDMQLSLIPLFQFGMFYNMDLELYPSGNFTLTGPVHTNNSLLAHPDVGSTNSIIFMSRVTAADYIFAYQGTKCATRWGDGTIVTPGDPTLGIVRYTDANNTASQISMKSSAPISAYNSLPVGLWADCRWGDTTRNITTALPTTTQLTNFKNWATSTYNGNLRAGIHGVTKLVLPGIGGYKETNDPATLEDDRNNGRQIIESPNHKRYNGTSFNATTDTAELKLIKISWRAGLYIMVNPDDTSRTGTLPNATTVTIQPRSYRCWLNTPSGTAYTCTEVVLPGQPSYGLDPGPDTLVGTADDTMYKNYLPNRLMMGTSVGSNQILRIPQRTHGTGSGYVLNMPAAPALGNSDLTVSGGTGTILMGDIVTIGNYNYLAASDLVGNTFKIASPGFVGAAAPANGSTITINAPANNLGTANASYTLNGNHAAAATTLTLNRPSGAGIFLPGSTISVGSGAGTYKYLITAAPIVAPTTATYEKIFIAATGLRAAANSGTAVTVDTTSGTLGTTTDYLLTVGHALGATSLSVNTGVGKILPGNIVCVGVDGVTGLPLNRYFVTSAANADTDTTAITDIRITPGLLVAAPVTVPVTPVFVDPYAYSGYAITGNGGSGSVYPADSVANAYAAEAYFYDIRRANNNGAMGAASARSAFNRSVSTPYTPRPIAKIDLDMARLKMMVARVIPTATTCDGYSLKLPDGTGAGWANSIYNGDTTTPPSMTALGLGIYDTVSTTYSAAASFPTVSPSIRQNPFDLYKAPSGAIERAAVFTDPTQFEIASGTLSAAWYDGVAIYIHSVDAEVRAQTTTDIADRIDSGVRLWNGRGPVASRTAATKTGCTIATNDAVYIVGHYNADGTVSAASSHAPDSTNEYLCSVYGDATVILSQPTYTQAGTAGSYTYFQSAGWNDAFSALPSSTSVTGWNTGALGGQDGVYDATTFKPGILPTINKPGPLGTAIRVKLTAVPTEVSTALVIGIVPSNHSPTGLTDRAPNSGANNVNSGGANNFPRFLEEWGDSNPLYIRGSMVALFESRVAMEPFTHSRCYNRPVRNWGLHDNLSLANHDVPLEPVVYSADRLGFRRLTAAQYASRKTTIEGWTELLP